MCCSTVCPSSSLSQSQVACSMRILLATGHPYIPQIAGGAQSSMNELAHSLMERGHSVAVAAGLSGRGWLALRSRVLFKLSGKPVAVDGFLGYDVFRAWFVWDAIEEISRRFKPSVVFVQSGFPARIASRCRSLGVPVAIYLRNVEDEDLGGDISALRDVQYVANSEFTARRFKEKFGVPSTVVYPLLQRSRYETTPECRNVTFVNPHPSKGSALALDIAEHCPDIPFVFIEGWTLDREIRQALLERIAKLGNVTLVPRTQRMVDVYRNARIVIVPSKWEEAFGRVAAEAHFSGIPVVANRIGGLPEAVGPGGLLIDPAAPVSEWVRAVRRLWADDAYWKEMSIAARHYGRRDALNPDHQVREIVAVLSATVAKSRF